MSGAYARDAIAGARQLGEVEAKAWYESPAYQDASKDRYQGGDYGMIIVEGSSS